MSAFEADYFDGFTSARHRVSVALDAGLVRVSGEGIALSFDPATLSFAPRLGSTPLRIGLPGDGLLVADADSVARVLPLPEPGGRIHALEGRYGFVAAAVAGIFAGLFIAYQVGVPWAANRVAAALPEGVEHELAEQSMRALDQFLEPTQIDPAVGARIADGFIAMRQHTTGPRSTLQFRAGRFLGANAVTLPGGTIIVTDELVRLMDNDDQVLAVLAHELGHVHHRHITRQVIQTSVTAIGSAMLLGDVSAIAGLAASVPVVMLQNGYSRDFEREADRYAHELLRRTGRSPAVYAEALAKLEQDAARRAGPFGNMPGYATTHPEAEERIRAAQEAAAR